MFFQQRPDSALFSRLLKSRSCQRYSNGWRGGGGWTYLSIAEKIVFEFLKRRSVYTPWSVEPHVGVFILSSRILPDRRVGKKLLYFIFHARRERQFPLVIFVVGRRNSLDILRGGYVRKFEGHFTRPQIIQINHLMALEENFSGCRAKMHSSSVHSNAMSIFLYRLPCLTV